MEEGSKYYEFSYLLSPALSPEEASTKETEIRDFLSERGAILDSWDSPKLRRLPYPINKQTEGYGGALRFTFARSAIRTIEETFRIKPWMLRTLLLEWKKLPPRRPRAVIRKEQAEAPVPTDEKALDEKLEEIFKGETIL